MTKTKQQHTGKEGEVRATQWYKDHGYEICHTNVHCSVGELDIVARKDNTLVFCEVKYFPSCSPTVDPFSLISKSKIKREGHSTFT